MHCLVVMHRLSFLLCLSFVSVQSQNVYTIENLMDNFVSDEEHLWKIINYHKNDATRTEDVKKVLEFYEIYMGANFGEIGIFQMISKEWLNDHAAFELIKHVATVNNTFAQAFALVKNKNYADILKFANELPRMITSHYSQFLFEHMENYFWSLIRNVKNLNFHCSRILRSFLF